MKAIYEAFIFVFQYWLWPFYLIPIVLSFGIFFGGELLLDELRNIDIQSDLSKINFQNELEQVTFQGFPGDAYEIKLLIIGVKLVLMVTCLKLSKYIILIALSPLLTIISAKTEEIITNNHYPFSWNNFIADIYRGVNFSLRNMAFQMVIFSLWYLITTFVEFLNGITPYFYFIVGAYYYGASLIDYTNERRRLSMDDSLQFIRKNLGVTLSIGSVFLLFFFTSYIGIIIGPITCVIAATIAIHYKFNLSKSKHAIKKQAEKKIEKLSKQKPQSKSQKERDEWG